MKFRITALLMAIALIIIPVSGCSKAPDAQNASASGAPETLLPSPTPAPTEEPTPGPEEFCFSRCLARLRIAKNDFYNNIDSAFAQNAQIAGYVFNILDFVYADKVLDLFQSFGEDDSALLQTLKDEYSLNEPINMTEIGENGICRISARNKWNKSFVFEVGYDRELDSGIIRLNVDEKLSYSYEWTTQGDCRYMQYINSGMDEHSHEEEQAQPLAGYRAVFFSNGEGSLVYGTFDEQSIEQIYGAAVNNPASFVFRTMAEYDIYKFYENRLDIRVDNASYSHLLGDLNGNGIVDADESPSPTQEPVIDDPSKVDRPQEP